MAGIWEVIAFLPRLRGRWITREARETEGAPIDARSARHFPRKRGKKVTGLIVRFMKARTSRTGL
jgi:hypothetical protein